MSSRSESIGRGHSPGNPRVDSDGRTLALVSYVHCISHLHILLLPPLFPFLKDRLGVGYLELGLALTIFNVLSAVAQAPMGFVVDRVGARKVLMTGMTVGSLAWVSLAGWLTYPWLLVTAALCGIANAVYHPANYSILSTSMSGNRMGRAFSIHTFAGYCGGAIAPPLMLFATTWIGISGALTLAGLLGLSAVALLLRVTFGSRPSERGGALRHQAVSVRAILTTGVLLLCAFFCLLSLSGNGIQAFSVVALNSAYGLSLASGNMVLTAWLLASAFGVLAGGLLADKTSRHAELASLCFGLSGVLVLLVGLTALPLEILFPLMALSGFLAGMVAPSRDMMVKRASRPGTEGRVFGIVSTGFNVGGAIGPMLFGWIMDHGHPRWVFFTVATFTLLTVLLTLWGDRYMRTAEQSPHE